MGWLEVLTHIDWIQKFWIVPAGMIALYFYGRFHFNTPDYSLAAQQGATIGNLLTPAPPIFTTYRAQYNRFALWYVLILEAAFLAFIFLPSIFTDIARIMNLQLPELSGETIQFRALLALFCLTGLLSSFPGAKDLDAFVLGKLHRAALIPDDARLLAMQLFNAPFAPHTLAAAAAKAAITSRDILRAVERKASGSFESNVWKSLCLLNQLQHKIENSKYNFFRLKLEKDLNDVARKREKLRPTFIAYFKEQANIVPDSAADIDQYLEEHVDDPRVAQLVEKRKENLELCNDLLYRLCLVVALLALATKFTPESVADTLKDLGFDLEVQERRIMDWDAVFRVTLAVFVTMLAFNALYALLVHSNVISAPITPSRQTTLGFAAISTFFYFIVLMVTIKLKKRWYRKPELNKDKAQNVIVAICSYFLVLPFSVILSLWIRHGQLSYAPLLFAVNQAVVAYFIGNYIDRSLNEQQTDWWLPIWQGLVQAVTAFCVLELVDRMPDDNPSTYVEIARSLVFAFQSGTAGFVMGYLFQKYYRRTRTIEGAVVGDITLRPRSV